MTGRLPEGEEGENRTKVGADLLSRLRSGETAALEEMVQAHQSLLYGLLLRLTGDPDEALDLVQETFIRALRGMASFRGESSIRTWLYRIAVNVFRNERRAAPRETVDPQELEEMNPGWWDRWSGRVPDPEEIVAGREETERLARAISRLPEEYRLVLLLRDREGHTTQEVADLVGISNAAVKSRLHRARLFVRGELLGESRGRPRVAEGVIP